MVAVVILFKHGQHALAADRKLDAIIIAVVVVVVVVEGEEEDVEAVLDLVQYMPLISAPVYRTSVTAWLYRHLGITWQKISQAHQ